MFPLRPLDLLAVFFYATALVTLGLFASRRRFAPVDYFLASRATRWPVIGLSMFAMNISSTALVGLTGGAYSIGLSVYDYEWTAVIILVFFCIFLLPSIIQAQIYTMPEYLERRYDHRTRILFALLTLFLNLAIDSAGVLYSGSLVCQILAPDWPLWCVAACLATAAGIYAIVGGLRSVIYTEAVQALVLLASATFVSVTAYQHAGGWQAITKSVAPSALSLIRPASDADLPWPGLLLGIPILGFYYWCTNQSIVQRMLSAKNVNEARWGALFAGLLKLTVLFLVVLPGICARVIFPHIAHADSVYPHLIFQLVPSGFLGIVVAAYVAATIVSIASLLNSASTVITMDIARYLRPNLSAARIVRIGRISTAALLVVAVAWAPQLKLFPSLWQYLQAVLAYAVPPVVALFGVGLCWRRTSADAAYATMIWGSVIGAGFFLVNGILHWSQLHFLYVAPLLTAIDILLLIACTLGTGRDDKSAPSANIKQEQYPSAECAVIPYWKDYRIQATVLVGLTTIIVILFR